MKVKELIKKLLDCDQDGDVFITFYNEEQRLTSIRKVHKGNGYAIIVQK